MACKLPQNIQCILHVWNAWCNNRIMIECPLKYAQNLLWIWLKFSFALSFIQLAANVIFAECAHFTEATWFIANFIGASVLRKKANSSEWRITSNRWKIAAFGSHINIYTWYTSKLVEYQILVVWLQPICGKTMICGGLCERDHPTQEGEVLYGWRGEGAKCGRAYVCVSRIGRNDQKTTCDEIR